MLTKYYGQINISMSQMLEEDTEYLDEWPKGLL